jgi:uncharacterized membrane protein YccF (DUF307 family)
MRTLANILWHIPFLGFLSALSSFLLGALLVVTVIAAPIGLGLIQYSKFLMAPFSYSMVNRSDLALKSNPLWASYSFIVKIIYLPFGIVLCVMQMIQIIGLCVTIVGIPMAIILAKSLTTYLQPVGKICVPSSVVDEIELRNRQKEADRYFNR